MSARQTACPCERLRVAFALSWLIFVLAALAVAVGLLLPGLYRDTAWVVPQNQGANDDLD
jgi:hypothetical protein